jgi:hypothetical protein
VVAVVALVVALGAGAATFALTRSPNQGDPSSAGSPPRTPGGTNGAGGSPGPPTPSSSTGTPTPTPSTLPAPSPIPGFLLIADRGNDRMLLVDSRKHVLWQYPKPGTAPSVPFNFDDDTFFTPGWGSIISNQEDQQTIQIISFPGQQVLWTYGHVNASGSGPGFLSTPDDAYVLDNGLRVVADVHNCRVLFIDAAHDIVKQYGTTGVCGHDPPRHLTAPNGDTPIRGGAGGMLVTEINGSWVNRIGPGGKLVWSFQANVRYPSDAQMLENGRVLLADYSSPGHVLITNTKGHELFRYGPVGGPGALDHPSLALMLPNGLIAVNDDYRDRVVLIDPATRRIVWQYGHTDVPGRGPGFLNTPDGMDFLPFDVAMRIPAIRALVQRHGAGR